MKLLLALAILAGIAAAVALFPLNGRTILERWEASPDVGTFLTRGMDEAGQLLRSGPRQATPSVRERTRASGSEAARPAEKPRGPVEHHTEDDRAEVDRIVSGAAK